MATISSVEWPMNLSYSLSGHDEVRSIANLTDIKITLFKPSNIRRPRFTAHCEPRKRLPTEAMEISNKPFSVVG